VKTLGKLAVPVAILALGLASYGYAQPAPKSKTAQPAQQPAAPPATPRADTAPTETPAQPGWTARCTSASREAPLECAIEQTAVISKTGQLLVLINIRVTSDTRTPIALLQLPLGLNLPGGAKVQIDEGKATELQIQTCENRGCFAGTSIAPGLLADLKSGKQLKVSFQNLNKETITVAMPLNDFASAYDKIK
jgi:invasion protein IalB